MTDLWSFRAGSVRSGTKCSEVVASPTEFGAAIRRHGLSKKYGNRLGADDGEE